MASCTFKAVCTVKYPYIVALLFFVKLDFLAKKLIKVEIVSDLVK